VLLADRVDREAAVGELVVQQSGVEGAQVGEAGRVAAQVDVQGGELLEVGLEGGLEEALLAAELLVEAEAVQTGHLDELLEVGALVPLASEQVGGLAEHLGAVVGLGAGHGEPLSALEAAAYGGFS